MLAIDFIFEHGSGQKWTNEMALQEIDDQQRCNCCQRTAAEWLTPNKGVTASFSGQTETHCLSCHMFYEGSFELLGLESIRAVKHNVNDKYSGKSGFGMDLYAKPSCCKKCHTLLKKGGTIIEDCSDCLKTQALWNKKFVEPRCDGCTKEGNQWALPYRGVQFVYKGKSLTHCVECQSKFDSIVALLNDPRVTKNGSLVPSKLGMLTGCAMVFSESESILGVNHTVSGEGSISGFYSKLSASPNCPYKLIKATGFKFVDYLIKNKPTLPFVYISEIKQSKDHLISNLRITSSYDEVFVCSNDAVECININALEQLLLASQCIPTKKYTDFKKTALNFYGGKLSPSSNTLNQFLTDETNRQLFSLLPENPHEGIKLIYYCSYLLKQRKEEEKQNKLEIKEEVCV